MFVVAFARSASASPEDMIGQGPRSPAMGGTGAAYATSFDAAYQNPSLLSAMRERALTLGFQGATFKLRARGEGLPGDVPASPAKGFVIGVGIPVPFGGILRDRVGVGLAFYTPTDILVRGRLLYPETPQFPLFPDRAQSLAARFGLGLDLGYGFRVGGGFAMLAQIAGGVVVATDASGKVGSRVEEQLVANYGPIFGASYEFHPAPGDVVRVGAVYRGTLDARFSVDVDARRLSTLDIPLLNIAGLAQYDPAQVGLEVAWSHGPWLVALGATYKRWSQYPGLLEPTIRCPEDEPDCGALAPTTMSFDDTLVPRIGAERAFELGEGVTWQVRAGYRLEPTPVPDELPPTRAWDLGTKKTENYPNRFFDGTRHAFSVGLGLKLAAPLPPISLDSYAQIHLMPERTVHQLRGADGTGVGTFGDATISGSMLVFGMLAGVAF
jgi:hypothetical protein